MKLPKGVVGKVVLRNLSFISPNDWNPNEMDDFTYESLKQGLRDDGWLISDSILVWGKDESGVPHNLIINGEHRWRAAAEIGMVQGPMVFIDGLTREEAIKLTIKLDNKRGKHNDEKLGRLVRTMTAPPDVLGMDLGFSPEALKRLQTGVQQPPARAVSIQASVEYCCPKCNHKWTDEGKKSKNKTK